MDISTKCMAYLNRRIMALREKEWLAPPEPANDCFAVCPVCGEALDSDEDELLVDRVTGVIKCCTRCAYREPAYRYREAV